MSKADRAHEIGRRAKTSATVRLRVEARRMERADVIIKRQQSSSARADEILAQRLAYALRHPHSDYAVLIDISAAEVLLQRLAPAPEEIEDDAE